MGPVVLDRGQHVAAAQLGQGRPLPGLTLALVAGEGDGVGAGERREQPARLDLRQLVRIPDQHQLGPDRRGGGDQPGELPGADHAGLVHDQHPAHWLSLIHISEPTRLRRISYAVFCLKKKKNNKKKKIKQTLYTKNKRQKKKHTKKRTK